MKRISIILLLLLSCLFTTPVLAADPIDPPSSIAMPDVQVYRNLAEPGDMLYVFQYDIAFTSDNYSTVPASDTFLFRLFDTDGTTLLASETPYVYSFFGSNGYGDGVNAFYLEADAGNPDWGDEVFINLYDSPSYFVSPLNPSFQVSPSDYTTSETQAENQDELKGFVLLLCDRLESAYQATGIILKASSDAGIVLSAYGELYFRGAIDGLQALSPELFFIQVYIPEVIPVTAYDMSLGDTYGARLDADDLGGGFTAAGSYIGVDGNIAAALIALAATVGLCIWTVRKGWNIEIGLAGGGIIGIFFALIMGDAIFTIIMIASLLAIMGIVWLVLLKRA